MTYQAVPTDRSTYVLVDQQGRPVGRVTGSRVPLDKMPPPDTIYLQRDADR